MRTQIHLYRDFYVVPAREMRLNISTSHLTMAVHVHVTYGRGSLSRHYMCTRTETERERPPASRGSRSERELRDFPRPREREMFYCLTTRRCATARCAMTVHGATAEAEHGARLRYGRYGSTCGWGCENFALAFQGGFFGRLLWFRLPSDRFTFIR